LEKIGAALAARIAATEILLHLVPRDEAYYGDPRTNYTYSRRGYKPLA
jgi:hypothetical protein